MEIEQGTAQLIPEWKYEDFLSERPYEWLYAQKGNKFLQQILLNRTQTIAKGLHFTGFMKAWLAYCKDHSTKVLGENQTSIPDQPIQLDCGQYVADEYGVSRLNEFGLEVEVSGHPLTLSKRSVDITTGHVFYDVAFRRCDGWRTIRNVEQETLLNARKLLTLANVGPTITTANATEIVRYFGLLIDLNFEAFPVGKITSRLGWTEDGKQFIPYASEVTYDQNGTFSKEYASVRCAGSFDTWRETISALRKPTGTNASFRIYLASSFASVLAGRLSCLPSLIHLKAPSGSGKTVAQYVAASVWAEPRNWTQSLNATTTANELLAGFVHDLPLCLDELQTVAEDRNGRDNLSKVVYNLCEGIGRGRGKKDGGLQNRQRWSSFILTTGEISITHDHSHEGAVNRVIELRARAGFIPDPRRTVGVVLDNYGWAGRAFVEHLQHYDAAQWNQLRQEHRSISSDLQSKGVSSKQADAAGLIILADRLADDIVLHDGYRLTSADLLPFLKSSDEIDLNLRTYEHVLGWLDENEARFEWDGSKPPITYGRIQEKGDDGTPSQYHIFCKSLNEELSEMGFDRDSFTEWAASRGIIQGGDPERHYSTVRKGQRVYNFFRLGLASDNQ